MSKSNTLEILSSIKQQYQARLIDLVKEQLVNEFNYLSSFGINSVKIVFENDDSGNVYFDDITGITISSEKNIKSENIQLSNIIDMMFFMVENINIDVDDTISITENKVIMNLQNFKK